jgi:hypothetical protein
MEQDFECIEKLMVNEELYRETLLHIPGSPHIPYLGTHTSWNSPPPPPPPPRPAMWNVLIETHDWWRACVREDFHLCKILSAEEHIPSTVRGMVNFEKSKYLYNIVSQVRFT